MTYRGNNEFFFLSRGQYNRITQIILNNTKENTMTDTKHTPTHGMRLPWYDMGYEVQNDNGETVTLNNHRSSIVKCVNLHEELVEALIAAKNDLDEWIEAARYDDDYELKYTYSVLDTVNKTLKKAGAL